jgi:multidrug efflux pump subunit AcrA (membrane-fusion protein)
MQEQAAGTARPVSPSRKIRISRKTAVLIALLALLATAGVAYLLRRGAEAATVEPALQTAKVRRGDLVVTASGAGTVVPAAEVELSFRSVGVLAELNVSAGDAVKSAEVLARLESNIQNEADFQALFTMEGVAQAQLAMLEAETALADAENAVIYLIGSDAWYWEKQMAAESATAAEVETARGKRDYFLGLQDVDDLDLAQARADLETARVALQDARAALEIVRAGPDALIAPIASLGPEMAKLEQARLAVESTRLTAPFDGKVTSLDAVVGATVGTSPVLSLASTDDLLVRFYLDETDVDKAAAGRSVTFTFDAYPDLPLEGEVIRVEPSLQIVDGTPVVVVWAKLPQQTASQVMPGMTVEAEVIAGKASAALIVPIQALRELSPGSYAVFVVQPDGELILTPVSVGLRDYANAEVVSGLEAGDLVSTGNVETK